MELMTKPAVAIIPARGGSKGIPRKNLVELNGAPLIWWSIKAALEVECIQKVIVTSDDDEILSVAEELGADALKRPTELATDEASTLPVLSHALLSIGADELANYQHMVLLQPTSPLRNAKHIEEAFHLLVDSQADGVISVVKQSSSPLKWFVEENGYLRGAVNNEFPFKRRQDLPSVYSANGAIYIVAVEEFLEKSSLLPNRTVPYCMDSVSSIDIDSLDDLKLAEQELARFSDKESHKA